MRVLITGIAGFLGSSLAKRLVTLGHEVVGLDVLHRAEAWRLGDLKLTDFLWQDVGDVRADQLEGVTHIVHTAASVDVGHSERSPRHAAYQSVNGTIAICEAARRARIPIQRLILISSYSAYGRVARQPIVATEPRHPTTVYGAMKASQEAIALSYFHSHKLPVAVIRSSTIFGPYSRTTLPVNLFMTRAMRGEPIMLTGDGRQTREQNFISNVIDAILYLLDARSSLDGEVFNIGSCREVSMLDLARTCISIAGSESKIEFAGARFGEEGRLALDCSKARQILGYEPKVHLAEGVRLTHDWMASRERDR